MDSRVEAFFQSLPGKRVAFLGIGVTNTGIIKLFAKKGAQVTACDKRSRDQLGKTAEELSSLGVSLKLGPDYLKGIKADMIFRTPGMKFFLPELEEYRRQGVDMLCDCYPYNAFSTGIGETTYDEGFLESYQSDYL